MQVWRPRFARTRPVTGALPVSQILETIALFQSTCASREKDLYWRSSHHPFQLRSRSCGSEEYEARNARSSCSHRASLSASPSLNRARNAASTLFRRSISRRRSKYSFSSHPLSIDVQARSRMGQRKSTNSRVATRRAVGPSVSDEPRACAHFTRSQSLRHIQQGY